MKPVDYIVLAVIAAALLRAAVQCIRRRKKGCASCCGCSADCGKCGGSCRK
ncbi:MAG: FeoB-associated Cys-rich membrane protein [Oscillospiraceae bacterium]|nr:FeoB-associated Cys-rich membrane protein [Oscillospiraceae bacterium]